MCVFFLFFFIDLMTKITITIIKSINKKSDENHKYKYLYPLRIFHLSNT